MRSFATLALILPAVLAVPLEFTAHHQYPPSSCVIAGIAYPDPPHALVLLGRRELSPPTGVSERAFTEFLVLCHESDRSSSGSLVARQQGSYLSGALGNPTGSDSTADTANPIGGAPRNSSASGDQSTGSSAAKPSPTPATTTSPAHSVARSPSADSPGETPEHAAGPTTSGTSTGTPANPGAPTGNDAPGTPANPAGSPPSGNTAATTPADDNASHDANASETPQPVPSTSDTPSDTAASQIVTFNLNNPLGSSSNASGNLGVPSDNLDAPSGNLDAPSDNLDHPSDDRSDTVVDVEGEHVGDEEPPMLMSNAAVSRRECDL